MQFCISTTPVACGDFVEEFPALEERWGAGMKLIQGFPGSSNGG
jgi:hypothetical protein